MLESGIALKSLFELIYYSAEGSSRVATVLTVKGNHLNSFYKVGFNQS